jgi:hypothetical protein
VLRYIWRQTYCVKWVCLLRFFLVFRRSQGTTALSGRDDPLGSSCSWEFRLGICLTRAGVFSSTWTSTAVCVAVNWLYLVHARL